MDFLGKGSGIAEEYNLRYNTLIALEEAMWRFFLLGIVISCAQLDAPKSEGGTELKTSAGPGVVIAHQSGSGDVDGAVVTSAVAVDQRQCWHVNPAGQLADEVMAMVEYSNGDLFLAATFHVETLDGDKADAQLTRLNAQGQEVWQRYYGARGEDVVSDAVLLSDDAVLVLGHTTSSGHGKHDAWVMNVAPDGSLRWEGEYGTTESEFLFAGTQDSAGGLIAVGGRAVPGTGVAVVPWVVHLDPLGQVDWEEPIITPEDATLRDVAMTADGRYVAVGGGEQYQQHKTIVLSFTEDADFQWVKYHSALSEQFAEAVVVFLDQGISVMGRGNSTITSADDAYVLHLGSNGMFLSQHVLGFGGQESFTSAVADGDDAILVAGFSGSFSPDRHCQMWVAKIARDGTIHWHHVHGTKWQEHTNAVLRSAVDDAVVIAGKGGVYRLRPDGSWCN